jgi:hypothetical protein
LRTNHKSTGCVTNAADSGNIDRIDATATHAKRRDIIAIGLHRLRRMPFATLHDYGGPASWWNDVPTEGGIKAFRADRRRGEAYADMLVDILIAHDAGHPSHCGWSSMQSGGRHSAASQWRHGQPQAAIGRVWLSHPTVAAHDRSICGRPFKPR